MQYRFPLLMAHLDLKGVHYRQDFLSTYLHRLKALGYNSVLVEYENCFPFRKGTFSRAFKEAWSREFLDGFLAEACTQGVEVIPLQQSLAHLEYIFRDESCLPMALPVGVPSDVDLRNPVARNWMKGLLKQVIEAHPNSRFIHLGMDEARSLSRHYREAGADPLVAFFEYLDELCLLCEEHGKVPLIWGDMLLDYLAPENIARICEFRDRVIIVHWDYLATEETQEYVRLGGYRCSRRLTEPEAPSVNTSKYWEFTERFFEEWPDEIRGKIRRFQVNEWKMEALFQAAFWKDLGFRVIGGAGGAITADGSLLPFYHQRVANVRLWMERLRRYELEGVVITQWARENSLAVPNVLPDSVWPILTQAASAFYGPSESKRADGGFSEEMPQTEANRLFHQIGLCREGWANEAALLQEMEQSAKFLSLGKFEWRLIAFLLTCLRGFKKLEYAKDQFRRYAGIGRLSAAGWDERVLAPIAAAKAALCPMEEALMGLLLDRYEGAAIEEWRTVVFRRSLQEAEELEARVRAEMNVRP